MLRAFIALALIICGGFLTFRAFGPKTRPPYVSGAPISRYLRNAALAGLSICLLLTGSIVGISVLYPGYQWNLTGALGTVALGLVAGLVAVAGSLWQFYAADRFREKLEEWRRRQQGG